MNFALLSSLCDYTSYCHHLFIFSERALLPVIALHLMHHEWQETIIVICNNYSFHISSWCSDSDYFCQVECVEWSPLDECLLSLVRKLISPKMTLLLPPIRVTWVGGRATSLSKPSYGISWSLIMPRCLCLTLQPSKYGMLPKKCFCHEKNAFHLLPLVC